MVRNWTAIAVFAGSLCVTTAQSAFAEESDAAATLSGIYACAEKTDDAERLACYDAAVGSVKAAEEAGEFVTVSREDVQSVQRDSFGFSMPSLPRLALPRLGSGDSLEKTDEDGVLTEVTVAITKIDRDAYDKIIMTLENGQVWRQTDSDRVFVSRKRPPKEATIKRAALGSFRAKLDGGTAFRVSRVQ